MNWLTDFVNLNFYFRKFNLEKRIRLRSNLENSLKTHLHKDEKEPGSVTNIDRASKYILSMHDQRDLE